jgi:hypothetical protein
MSPRVFGTAWFFTYTYLLNLSEIAVLLLALLMAVGARAIEKRVFARTGLV